MLAHAANHGIDTCIATSRGDMRWLNSNSWKSSTGTAPRTAPTLIHIVSAAGAVVLAAMFPARSVWVCARPARIRKLDEPSGQRYTAKPSVLLSRQFASAVFHRTETTKPRLDQFAKCDILDYTTQKCLQKALISGRLINEPLVWCMRLKNKEIITFICSSFHSENQGKSEWESYHDHAIKFAQPKSLRNYTHFINNECLSANCT